MNIGIVGAGWAGLAAAHTLHQTGHKVTVYEAAREYGGRARRVWSEALDNHLDNGQHIMLGAYTQSLALMRELGVDPRQALVRCALHLETADGHFRFKVPDRSWAGLEKLVAITGARGWRLRDKLNLVRGLVQIMRYQGSQENKTLQTWLEQHGQTNTVVNTFWTPLCIAALNTLPADADAALMARVLRDSLTGAPGTADILIARHTLSDLWANALAQRLEIKTSCAIRRLTCNSVGYVLNGQWAHDALVVATPPNVASKLLRDLPSDSAKQKTNWLSELDAFEFAPIATATFKLATNWRQPPPPMLMLNEHTDRDHTGQWLFVRPAPNTAGQWLACVVISQATALVGADKMQVLDHLTEQVVDQTRRFGPMPRIVGRTLLNEKRATFVARPGLKRPLNETLWPRLVVAGDWTQTGYPAVLEGAVRSGLKAAAILNQNAA